MVHKATSQLQEPVEQVQVCLDLASSSHSVEERPEQRPSHPGAAAEGLKHSRLLRRLLLRLLRLLRDSCSCSSSNRRSISNSRRNSGLR